MEYPARKQNRIETYDYSQNGAYFITICTRGRKRLLSKISVGTAAPTGDPKRHSAIAQFVRTLKRFCNQEYGENIWQRSYYDHVVRNKQDYDEIWEYIGNNPMKWLAAKEK